MDFTFTPEQRQFADALRRWATKDYDFEQRRRIVESSAGVSEQAWSALAELGMTALPVPEADGGFGGGAADQLLVMQELGRALVVEPYQATVLGAEFLKLAGGHAALLARVADGSLKLACALGEADAGHDLFDIAVRATAGGDGFLLDGEKTVVLHGAQAGALIVSARSAGGQRDTDGISLFVLAADTPGIGIRDYRSIDGQRAATVTFTQVAAPAAGLLGAAGQGWPVLEAATDFGVALLCFEAIGAMDALFAATLEYLKTRQQFGAQIGKFQVLQHRMADMFIHLEQARSMAMLVAAALDQSPPRAPAQRRRLVSAAKVRVGQAIKFVGQQALQLHGGMGMSNELAASHWFKRLSMIELTLGDTDHHLQRFIANSTKEAR